MHAYYQVAFQAWQQWQLKEVEEGRPVPTKLICHACTIVNMNFGVFNFYWETEASPTLTSTIEIEIPARAGIYIYTYVQKNAWHSPEGKCHVLHRRCIHTLLYRLARTFT